MKTILSVILTVVTLTAVSQDLRNVYGHVHDIYGNSLKGVKVTSQEKFSKTFTNEKGWYRFKVPATDSVLYFIHEDYETEIVRHNGKSRFDVRLSPAQNAQLLIQNVDDELEVDGVYFRNHKKENMLRTVSSMGVKTSAMPAMNVGGVFRQPDWNTENYASINENGFKDALINPLSTFSIDVDKASYSNVRRYLNQGEMPPADAVKVEEMVNYFNYSYPEPGSEHPFSVTAELSECPWDKGHNLLLVGLKGKSIEKSGLPPSNLVFLLDVSGSMNAWNKLGLVKKAFGLLVNELRPNDRVAIVVYAGAAGKVLDSTPGNKKQEIMEAIGRLQAGGSTAGGEGLKLAYKIANENFIEGGNNRIILATDGDFNVGVSSTSEMERLVEKERENGVFITVLGFGMRNIKDDKMETIADKGNGNYAYIDNIQEARKVLISEFGGTLFTIAKDVKFQLEFNPSKVKSYRLIGYENRLLNDEDFNDDAKDAGEMGSGHTVTALYEIIPAGSDGQAPSVDPLKYQDRQPADRKYPDEVVTIKLRYKEPDGNKSKLFDAIVKDSPVKISQASDNLKFASAVASFGMLLRGSEYMGDTSVEKILNLAQQSKGTDPEGYRTELIQLVKTVRDLNFFAEE